MCVEEGLSQTTTTLVLQQMSFQFKEKYCYRILTTLILLQKYDNPYSFVSSIDFFVNNFEVDQSLNSYNKKIKKILFMTHCI